MGEIKTQEILCALCAFAVKIGLLHSSLFSSDNTFWVDRAGDDDRTSAMSSLFKGDRERKRASAKCRVIRFSNEPSATFFVVLGKACSGHHARGSPLARTGPLGMQAVL